MKCFALLLWCLLLLFQSANTDDDEILRIHDDALLAFVRGPTKFEKFCNKKGITNEQNIRLLAQFYGTHIGIFNFMRQSWHCAKAEEDERKKCLEYQAYMDIFYEYLFNVSAGRSAGKPKFRSKYFGVPLFDVLMRLSIIAKYYFGNTKDITEEDYRQAEFQLEKSDDLNYTETPTKTEPIRVKFDKIMQKMVKKTLENIRSNRAEHDELSQKIYENELEIAKLEKDPEKRKMPTPPEQLSFGPEDAAKECAFASDFQIFYDILDSIKEEAFVDFIKGNFEIYFTKIVELELKIMKNYYLDKSESDVVLLYAMKKNWNCANAKFKNECEELQQYLAIIYEYLFRVSVGIPSVRPMFRDRGVHGRWMPILLRYDLHNRFEIRRLSLVLQLLSFYQIGEYVLQESNLKLINETELNFKIHSEFSEITFEEQLVLMAIKVCNRENGDKKEQQQIIATEMEGLIRSAFEHTLKKKYEKRVKEAFEAREELDVMLLKIKQGETEKYKKEFYQKQKNYDDKYIFLSESPFVPQIPMDLFKLDSQDRQESIWKIDLFIQYKSYGYVQCRKCDWESEYDIACPELNKEPLKDHLFSPIHAESEYAKKYKELEKEKGKKPLKKRI